MEKHWIKELREQSRLTQQEMASRLDISQAHMSRLENGLSTPTVAGIIRLVCAAEGADLEMTVRVQGRSVYVKQAMSVIVRNKPSGYHWGWGGSKDDPRMHLQVINKGKDQPKKKIWLESQGKRVFEPDGQIKDKILTSIRKEVKRDRQRIESEWVAFMIRKKRLTFELTGSLVTLTAYPGKHHQFQRKIDLKKLYPGVYTHGYKGGPPTLDDLELSEEFAALVIWRHKPESRQDHVFLAKLLWKG